MTAPAPLPHERAVLTILGAASRPGGEPYTAAYSRCTCPAVVLDRLTSLRETAVICAAAAPYADTLDPSAADDPQAARAWLDAALTRLGLRPGEGRFPARHSHSTLPLSAVQAIREDPDNEGLLHDICSVFDVTPAECLAAALPDAAGWSPTDDTGPEGCGPCTCDDDADTCD